VSVFSQTEFVEQVSEASVAQAIAESQRGWKRGPFLVVGALGVSAIVGLGLLWLFVPGPETGPARRVDSFAARALEAALARDRAREEDEAGRPPEVVRLRRELRSLLTKCAESMPTDPDGQRLLERATDWYKEDVLTIWMDCRSTTQMLARAKPPIDEEPRRILEGAVEVMERLRIQPNRDQSIRQFGALYESYRERAPRGERFLKQIGHQEAVDWLVELQKFDN